MYTWMQTQGSDYCNRIEFTYGEEEEVKVGIGHWGSCCGGRQNSVS